MESPQAGDFEDSEGTSHIDIWRRAFQAKRTASMKAEGQGDQRGCSRGGSRRQGKTGSEEQLIQHL